MLRDTAKVNKYSVSVSFRPRFYKWRRVRVRVRTRACVIVVGLAMVKVVVVMPALGREIRSGCSEGWCRP